MRLKGRASGAAVSKKTRSEEITPFLTLSIIQTAGVETYYDITLEGPQDEIERLRAKIGTNNFYTPGGSFGRPLLILDTQDGEMDVLSLFELYKNLILTVIRSF